MVTRIAAWAVVATSVACVALAGWIAGRPLTPDLLAETQNWHVAQLGGAVASWTICGAVLVSLRPHNVVGWLLLLFGATAAWQIGLAAYGGYGLLVADPTWPAARWVALAGAALFVPALFGPSSVLLALYPDGHLPARWWRWPVGTAAGGVVALTVVGTVSPEPYSDVAPGYPSPLALSPRLAGALVIGLLTLILLATVVVWIATVVRLVRARSPERQQLAWLACTVMPLLIGTYSGLPTAVTTIFGFLVPVAVAVGVLRYQMFGIDVVLRRGLVYGTLTALVVLVYLLVAAAVGSAIDSRSLPAVLAAAVVSVVLMPARERLQQVVNRLMYGDRRDPLRAVSRLADQVADITDLDLMPAAVTAVVGAVRARGARLVAPDGRVLAQVGAHAPYEEVLPLRAGGHEVGRLEVATRAGQQAYTHDDRRLLSALAVQLGTVVRAVDLNEALEVERDRVLTAALTERDRIRRDLHDGLGPSLSGIGLGLQGVDDALRAGDVTTVTALLDRIGAEVETAVNEIRRLIDGLRPAALDEIGLVATLARAAQTASLRVPVDLVVDDLPHVAPHLETTAYRIIAEALTNITRHAGAHHASITLSADQRELTVAVTDDGAGIGSAADGVGLTSMRRRAEMAGGRLVVDSSPAGTTISAILPLEAP